MTFMHCSNGSFRISQNSDGKKTQIAELVSYSDSEWYLCSSIPEMNFVCHLENFSYSDFANYVRDVIVSELCSIYYLWCYLQFLKNAASPDTTCPAPVCSRGSAAVFPKGYVRPCPDHRGHSRAASPND